MDSGAWRLARIVPPSRCRGVPFQPGHATSSSLYRRSGISCGFAQIPVVGSESRSDIVGWPCHWRRVTFKWTCLTYVHTDKRMNACVCSGSGNMYVLSETHQRRYTCTGTHVSCTVADAHSEKRLLLRHVAGWYHTLSLEVTWLR